VNRAAAVPPQGAADALVARYEALRRWIVDGAGGSSRWGLALLRRQGLAAWIATWAAAPGAAAVVDPRPRWRGGSPMSARLMSSASWPA
jgi:hypothetical protein